MEAPTIPRALAIITMVVMILAFVPATTAGGDASAEPQSHDPPPCITDRDPGPDGEWEYRDKTIVLPKYATDQLPITTLSWSLLFNDNSETEDEALEDPINGLDAYIIDFGCDRTSGLFYCLTGDDSGVNAYDLQVTFRDSSFQAIKGPINPDDSRDVCDEQFDTYTRAIPDDTRYVEIVTVDGSPGACGCLDDDTLLPGAVEATFLVTQ